MQTSEHCKAVESEVMICTVGGLNKAQDGFAGMRTRMERREQKIQFLKTAKRGDIAKKKLKVSRLDRRY